eukprot:3215251-Pleurochrysis_carterae.AAC.1
MSQAAGANAQGLSPAHHPRGIGALAVSVSQATRREEAGVGTMWREGPEVAVSAPRGACVRGETPAVAT